MGRLALVAPTSVPAHLPEAPEVSAEGAQESVFKVAGAGDVEGAATIPESVPPVPVTGISEPVAETPREFAMAMPTLVESDGAVTVMTATTPAAKAVVFGPERMHLYEPVA